MPDYTGSCIRDDFEGQIDLNDLKLSNDFLVKLNTWHEAYKKIIPLNENERKKRNHEIEKLDEEGLRLRDELKLLILGGAKIKYFSEDKGQIIDV